MPWLKVRCWLSVPGDVEPVRDRGSASGSRLAAASSVTHLPALGSTELSADLEVGSVADAAR